MSTEPDKLTGAKLSFQMNHISVCGTMMAAFVLDAMSLSAAFKSALSNDLVAKHPELWSGVRFRIVDDPISYELRASSIAIDVSLKCCNPESFLSFKASLELSFSRIMHAHMLQRLFETSVRSNACNFFLDLLIRRICRLLSRRGIWLVGILLVIHVLLLQKAKFGCAYKQYGILFHKQTFKICLTPCHVV